MVCIDTSIIIGILRGYLEVKTLLASYSEGGMIATTSITEYELLRHGDMVKKNEAGKILDRLIIYPFDRKAASEAAKIFAELKSKGTMTNENDILIAATAFSNNEMLITKDSDFKRMSSDKIVIV